MVKKFQKCLLISTQYTNKTDTLTDGQIPHDGPASRGKVSYYSTTVIIIIIIKNDNL